MFGFRSSPTAEGFFGIKLPGLAADIEELEYETLTLNELPAFIEELFFEHWNTPTCTILFYTIYLLAKKGEIFLDVRDYAVEVLRIFWQIILPTKAREQIEKFIKSYGFFCFDVLYRVGLIDIDRKIDEEKSMDALFKIKASRFFYEWGRFIQSHKKSILFESYRNFHIWGRLPHYSHGGGVFPGSMHHFKPKGVSIRAITRDQ